MYLRTEVIQNFTDDIKAVFEQLKDITDDFRNEKRRCNMIMQYLTDHYTDPTISAESIASYFGIGRNTLTRLIKQETGSTYLEILTGLRIQEAKRLLRETNHSFKEITELVGYSDVSSFHRKFVQVTNMTPQDYRSSYV